MNVKHNPNFNVEEVERIYSERDGVPIKYVCTTDLRNSDIPADIFYRETPHPEFGNRYFGLFYNPYDDGVMITGADIVEDFDFVCTLNDECKWEYSESHHKFKGFKNGNMIDGGREYTRSSGDIKMYQVYNGEFRPFNELMAEGVIDE